MKYFFSLLVLLIVSFSASSQCTYVIDMQDSFGDGWNNGNLTVTVNGAPFGPAGGYTLLSGSVGTASFTVNHLDVVAFTYNSGFFDNEVSYQISVGGVQLFADGIGVSPGLAFTHQCGGCDPPGGVVAFPVFATTANIAWQVGGGNPTSWLVEYGLLGFTPGTGTGTVVATSTMPLGLTGLSPSTTYDCYVQSICSSGDTSLPSSKVTFTTACMPVTNYPLWEGFNSTSPTQNCWQINNNNGDFSSWSMDYAFNPFEGDECAAINTDFNNGNNDDYLISPQLTLTGGERIRFWHRCQSTFEPNDYQLVLSTTGPAPANFTTVLFTDTSTSTSYTEEVVEMYGITGNVYLAFRIPSGGLDGWILYIDDILIEQPTVNDAGVSALVSPTLPAGGGFTPFNVRVTNYGIATLNSFTIEWELGQPLQPQPPVTYTAGITGPPLGIGESVVVNLGNLNLPTTAVEAKIWTTLPNALVDEDFSNDTLALTLCPGLSGTYSVGHPSSDFPTVAEALEALKNCGVSGPVTMEFAAGVYPGPWSIGEIPGANAVNTVTFDGLNSANATLSHTGFGINTAATLILDGAAYFTIKNFTIRSTGINTAYAVLFINNAHHNTLENNIISVPSSLGLNNVVAVLASADYAASTGSTTEGNNANWNLIKDNDISGGVAAIILEGGETNSTNIGNQIVGNTIHGAQNYGIYVDEQDSLLISGNNVLNIQAVGSDAMMLFDINNYSILGNNVVSNDFGIAVWGGFQDYCNDGLIVNNMVSCAADGEALYLRDVLNVKIYHNTLSGMPACYLDNQANVDLRNNILSTTNDYCFFTFDAVSMTAMDHNLYHIAGPSGSAVRFGSTTYATLALWQASVLPYDDNSVTGNPNFVSGLYLGGSLAIDTGDLSLAVPVLTDIEGDSRPMGSRPDIGADEHVIIANDAMAVGLVAPYNCGDPAADIIVEIANVGTNSLISAAIKVNVSGAGVGTFNTTQPLIQPGNTIQVNMGQINTAAGGTFIFQIIVNSSGDLNASNDTIVVSVDILPSNQVALTMTGDNLICMGGRANISATASYAPATILWYDAPVGGNLVHIGPTFNTGILTTTTMYYAEIQGCNSPRAVATVNLDTQGINVDLGPDVTICGGTAAIITPIITVSPATNIVWSDGSQFDSLQASIAGQYTIEVANANGCIDTDTINVMLAPAPTVADALTNVTCGGFSNGAIDLSLTGGIGPFSFAWSNGMITEDLTNIPGGSYIVTVTDNGTASNCSYVSIYNVAEPLAMSSNIDVVGLACSGTDGTVDITVFGGTAPYTFLWTPSNQTTEDASGLAAGTQTVAITDSNGCTITNTATVTAPTPIVVTVDTIYDEILAVQGGIDITATGGTGQLVYSWNTGATTANITGLVAGAYSVTVTDLSTGCTQVVDSIIVVYKVPDFVNNITALNAFKLYPNPTEGRVWVNMTLAETTNVQLNILSITGQVLQSYTPRETIEQNYEIDMSAYPSGVYLARFVIGAEVMTTKIIVE